MDDNINVGDILSYIRKNPDGTRDQIYVEVVETQCQTCKRCFIYNREPKETREKLCYKCTKAMETRKQNFQLKFHHAKFM